MFCSTRLQELLKSICGMIPQGDGLLGLMTSHTLLECPIVLSPSQNDLYSCLDPFFKTFTLFTPVPSNTETIVVRITRDNTPHGPAELPLAAAVAAALNTTGQSSVAERKEPFRYPAVLQIDRWSDENQQAAAEWRNQLKEVHASTRDLLRRSDVLSGSKACIPSPDLPLAAHSLHRTNLIFRL